MGFTAGQGGTILFDSGKYADFPFRKAKIKKIVIETAGTLRLGLAANRIFNATVAAGEVIDFGPEGQWFSGIETDTGHTAEGAIFVA